MNRLGLIHPSTLTGKNNQELGSVYHGFDEYAIQNLGGSHITYKFPSTGAMVGPFGILLHTPQIGRAYLDLSVASQQLPGLSERTKHIIALVVAANERASFMGYAHEQLALQHGLAERDVRALRAGLHTESFDEEGKAAYTVARELCVSSGVLSDKTWNEAFEVLGRQGIVATIHLTAFQRYIATFLRGFDAQVPPPGERIEDV